ncbi:MAG: hypothetical protein ACE5JG_01265 [Planctomycetota bacterium]
MKTILSVVVAIHLALFAAPRAWAHGGAGPRGPGGPPPGLRVPPPPPPVAAVAPCGREPTDPEPPPPPPSDPNAPPTPPADAAPPPPCLCAAVECRRCADYLLATDALAVRELETATLHSWGDLRRIQVRVTFQARDDVLGEAHAPVRVPPLFAVSAARVERKGASLAASPTPSQEGRKRYIETKRRELDPLLLVRRSPGSYDLRAFPVGAHSKTVVVIEGYALADRPPRLYRTGDRFLAVAPLPAKGEADGARLADHKRGRALRFLDRTQAQRRFGAAAVSAARQVPCVAQLEAAAGNTGRSVWLALEPEEPETTEAPARVAPAGPES